MAKDDDERSEFERDYAAPAPAAPLPTIDLPAFAADREDGYVRCYPREIERALGSLKGPDALLARGMFPIFAAHGGMMPDNLQHVATRLGLSWQRWRSLRSSLLHVGYIKLASGGDGGLIYLVHPIAYEACNGQDSYGAKQRLKAQNRWNNNGRTHAAAHAAAHATANPTAHAYNNNNNKKTGISRGMNLLNEKPEPAQTSHPTISDEDRKMIVFHAGEVDLISKKWKPHFPHWKNWRREMDGPQPAETGCRWTLDQVNEALATIGWEADGCGALRRRTRSEP